MYFKVTASWTDDENGFFLVTVWSKKFYRWMLFKLCVIYNFTKENYIIYNNDVEIIHFI